jgi:hypothetical protein
VEASVEAGPRVERVGAVQICRTGEPVSRLCAARACHTCHECDVAGLDVVARAREQGDRWTLL